MFSIGSICFFPDLRRGIRGLQTCLITSPKHEAGPVKIKIVLSSKSCFFLVLGKILPCCILQQISSSPELPKGNPSSIRSCVPQWKVGQSIPRGRRGAILFLPTLCLHVKAKLNLFIKTEQLLHLKSNIGTAWVLKN